MRSYGFFQIYEWAKQKLKKIKKANQIRTLER